MARNEHRDTQYNKKKKKIALLLTYTLIILIVLLVVFMFFDASDDKKQSNNTSEIADQVYITDTPTQLPTIESVTVLHTPTILPTATPIAMVQIPYGNAEDLGLDAGKLNELDSYIQGEIDNGFPGAVLMIAKDGYIVFHKAYGYTKKYEGMSLMSEYENMQTDTMFDLASLSKIYSTTFSIMKLVDMGEISLDGKVADYLSDYNGINKDKITVKMLLSHNAGYIKDYYFYKDSNGYKTFDRDMVYNYVKQIPLDVAPSTKFDYNNMNYILLGMIVEEVSGMRIDDFARVNIYEPLGIENKVTYRPLDIGIEKSNIAATERLGNTRDGSIYFDGIRQYTLQGEVHDENTYYCMEQVSGHAGLFATNYGLTVLNQVLLNNGEYSGVRIYSEETINNWLQYPIDAKYQLGFWNAGRASDRLKSYVSDSTFYHNGWTGTATIVDKDNNLSIILLTNKRHVPCPDGDFQLKEYSIDTYTTVIQKVYDALKD